MEISLGKICGGHYIHHVLGLYIGTYIVSIFGSLSLVFFSVVSLTLAVLLKESFKTWIVAALFLIVSTVLLKIDLGSDLWNQLAYFKLNNTWQYFFDPTINWTAIGVNSIILIGYTLATMCLGLLLFQKKDI